jgi:hypothetical protein
LLKGLFEMGKSLPGNTVPPDEFGGDARALQIAQPF